MNTKLVFVVVLILTSVYSMPSIDDDRDDYTEPPETDDDDDNEDLIVDSTTSVSFEQLDEAEDEYEYGKISRWTLPLAMLFRYKRRRYQFESNITVSKEIGPKFRRKQLVGLLKQDLKDAYQRKCTKISADENAFERFMSGKTELKNCTKMWLTNPANDIKTKDFKSIVMTFCQKRDGLFNCFNDFKALKDRCSFPSEIDRANQLRDIVTAILDSLCSNGGSDLVSLVSHDGEGRKCIIENTNEIRTCRNKAVYGVVKRILTKFIENEHFEFKMNKDDCNEFDAVRECFVTSVENCVDPIAKNQISSMFRIFREQTSCGTAS